ncbi:MAG: glycosyltransferase family 2 protein [Deltaproteobacteria bacterium]|nr:glycosyltransferase family 2 protein [Deltaproteobacteria bacterium]
MDTPFIKGLVSIITPAYNAAPFLEETMSSVKAQTYEAWEWIIADDGSDDDTVAIVEKAFKKDVRIRLLPWGGEKRLAAGARNRAMQHARGEFFAFLDADDLWEPEKTGRQVAYLREHPEADAICCWHDLFGDKERVKLESRMMNFLMHAKQICDRSDLLKELPFQTSTLLMRRGCYGKIGGMDEDPRLRSGQDVEYFARLIEACNVHRLMETLTHYRLTSLDDSLNRSHFTPQNQAAWNVFEVMNEKGYFTPGEARGKRSSLYYDQAINNLFHFDAPFRPFLIRSILSGHPPLRAMITFSLSFLGRPLLKKTLLWMLSVVNQWKLKKAKKAGAVLIDS